MNRVFLTGKAGEVRILFTPRGEKIALFPVRVDDFDVIEVMYLCGDGILRGEEISGKTVIVVGSLVKPDEERRTLRVKARNIAFMED